MYVQFSDDKKEVISVFVEPQDPEVYPNSGEVDEDDQRYVAFMEQVREHTI